MTADLAGLRPWSRRRRWIKRGFDLAVAGVLTALTAPLMALIALAIRLDSPGPAIYRQERVGENGRPFTILKFRSMRASADPSVHQAYVTRLIQENLSVAEVDGGTLKLENDSRITRVGRWIRATSLDELPQFWNVLRGEMSLVGPRPPIPYEVAVYQPWHLGRLAAPPGLTGLWQITARNQVSFDEMVRMDLDYIERQSLGLDISILLRTPLQALVGRGGG
jgi:lipopolysaccharide/colanic/teichoic acid biosynthesis glycosyltransferase